MEFLIIGMSNDGIFHPFCKLKNLCIAHMIKYQMLQKQYHIIYAKLFLKNMINKSLSTFCHFQFYKFGSESSAVFLVHCEGTVHKILRIAFNQASNCV